MRRLVALAVVAAASACRGDAVSVRDSAFVATMVELRSLPASPGDTGARNAVLRRHGFTAATLEAAATELARDPVRAAAVWQRIENPPPAPAPPPVKGRPGPAVR